MKHKLYFFFSGLVITEGWKDSKKIGWWKKEQSQRVNMKDEGVRVEKGYAVPAEN